MTRLRTLKGSKDIPLFAHRILTAPTDEKNAAGKPYKNVTLSPAVNNSVQESLLPGDSPLLDAGFALCEALKSGLAKANYESAGSTGGGGGSKDEEADAVFGDSKE